MMKVIMKVIKKGFMNLCYRGFVRPKRGSKTCVFFLFVSIVLFGITFEKKESLSVQCFRFVIENNYTTKNLIETKDDKEHDLLIAEGGSLDVMDSFAFAIEEEARYVMLINQDHIYFLERESCCIKVRDYLCEGEQMKVTIVKTVLESEPEQKKVRREKDFQGQSFYLSRSIE